jgi:hypothetical protein
MDKTNYLRNEVYFSFVEFLANSSKDFEEIDVRLRVELSLISGACGVKSETDHIYLGALDQAILLLAECGSLEKFRHELMGIK